MLGNHFYNQIVRKNIIAFGTLFNNITMKSTDPDTGNVLEESKVPLAYGPKQKFLVRIGENQSSSKVAITLPRLYFEMTTLITILPVRHHQFKNTKQSLMVMVMKSECNMFLFLII